MGIAIGDGTAHWDQHGQRRLWRGTALSPLGPAWPKEALSGVALRPPGPVRVLPGGGFDWGGGAVFLVFVLYISHIFFCASVLFYWLLLC